MVVSFSFRKPEKVFNDFLMLCLNPRTVGLMSTMHVNPICLNLPIRDIRS